MEINPSRALPGISQIPEAEQPDQLTCFLQQADLELTQGNLSGTEASLRSALTLAPGNPQIINALGNILLRLNRLEDARREFTKAIILSPDFIPARANLAVLLSYMGQTNDSLNHLRRVLEKEPEQPDMLRLLGHNHTKEKLFKEAIQAYSKVLDKIPGDVESLAGIKFCYEEINKSLNGEIEKLRSELKRYKTWVPAGHFYSPVPDLAEIRPREHFIFDRSANGLPAVDLHAGDQLRLLDEFKDYYCEQPFTDQKQPGLRYHFLNPNFSFMDALSLYCMIRHARPNQIIEIGSGYSSCVTLDTNELFFENSIDCTFIEPYPDLLNSLIKENDKQRVEIVPTRLQDVDAEIFTKLEENDILFIDSTHVSRVDSDVNHIFFRILPVLKSGVYVHFHDIGYPFEYPKEWVYEGRAWNEAYMLRAFLEYNPSFRIRFFNSYLGYKYPDKLAEAMPLCLKNLGGSIWLQKQ